MEKREVRFMTEETKLILEKLDSMDKRFDRLESEVKAMKSDIGGMKSDMDGMKTDIRDIRLTLENETNRNIRRVAEAHLDLSRKLDEALKADREKEMMALRLNILENDVRRLKEHAGIA